MKELAYFLFSLAELLEKKIVINVMMIILKGVQKKARKLINGNVQPPHCASDNNICHFTRKEKENLEKQIPSRYLAIQFSLRFTWLCHVAVGIAVKLDFRSRWYFMKIKEERNDSLMDLSLQREVCMCLM